MAVVEYRAPQSGAQRHHDFESEPGHGAGPGDFRIVQHDRGQLQPVRHGLLRVEVAPSVHEVGVHSGVWSSNRHEMWCGHDPPVPDHPGDPHRHPVRSRQMLRQVGDDADQAVRW